MGLVMNRDRKTISEEMNWADYCDALRSEHYAGALTKLKAGIDVKDVLNKASVEQDVDIVLVTRPQQHNKRAGD